MRMYIRIYIAVDLNITFSWLQVLVTYGAHALTTPIVGDPYSKRYKSIWICLTILTRALGGNYVNFGVFDLYGDPALKVQLSSHAISKITPLSLSVCRKTGILQTAQVNQYVHWQALHPEVSQ